MPMPNPNVVVDNVVPPPMVEVKFKDMLEKFLIVFSRSFYLNSQEKIVFLSLIT